jgi:hypothetical protein
MKGRALVVGSALVGLVALAGGASAASPSASCVAVITSWEATQLPPGSVGAEVSGLAHGADPLGQLVRELAASHAGSLGGCAG